MADQPILEKLRLAQLPFRLSLLWKLVQRRLFLWKRWYRLASAKRREALYQDELERTWQRWESIRSKRPREQLRKRLSSLEQSHQAIGDELASIEQYLSEITKQDNTLFRWLWQGHVDDQDGDPSLILGKHNESND